MTRQCRNGKWNHDSIGYAPPPNSVAIGGYGTALADAVRPGCEIAQQFSSPERNDPSTAGDQVDSINSCSRDNIAALFSVWRDKLILADHRITRLTRFQ